MSGKTERGFTVIEIFAYTGMTLLVVLLAYVSFSHFHTDYVLESGTKNVVAILNQAKTETVSSKQNQYSVYLSSTSIVFFKGKKYQEENPENVTIGLHPLLTISEVNLASGGNTITFEKASGKTSDYGTISIAAKKNKAVKTVVTVEASGEVEGPE